MTTEKELLKFISIFITGFLLLSLFFPGIATGALTSSGPIEMTPPSAENVQSFWKGIVEGLSSFLGKFKIIGKWIDCLVPFFENAGKGIGNQWSSKAKPWIEYRWIELNIYLNQEIKIE